MRKGEMFKRFADRRKARRAPNPVRNYRQFSSATGKMTVVVQYETDEGERVNEPNVTLASTITLPSKKTAARYAYQPAKR